MTDSIELFILDLIESYMDMMYRQYLDSIGEEDYILTKVRFYGEQSEKIKLVICLITHPFISVSAKEKGTISPVFMGKYKNSVNNTGNGDYNNFCQVTYNYSVDEPSYTIGLSVGATLETEFSLVYCIDINIQLNQVVESAQVNLKFTSPLGTSPYYELPFICENCRVTSVSDRILYLQVRNSDTANVKIIYSYPYMLSTISRE